MRRLFQALTRTSDGAFIIDEHNRIVFWNDAAEALLGYTAAEAARLFCYQLFGARDEQGQTLCQRFCRFSIRAAQGETLPNLDVFAQKRDGQGRWLNLTTFMVPTVAPAVGDVIVHLFRDATGKKSNERFVRQIMEASQALQDETYRPRMAMDAAETAPDPRLQELTPREREVLRLLAEGLGTEEMAALLNISLATTRNHVQSVLNKLRVHSRLEAVAYVYQNGLFAGND
jgi:PAS domain S-box-containing protein